MRYAYLLFLGMILSSGHWLMADAGNFEQVKLMRSQAHGLLNKAISFFEKEGVDRACNAFAHDVTWRVGPISLFVLGLEGTIFVDNGYAGCIWSRYDNLRDFYGAPLVPTMISRGQAGGWVTYSLSNNIRHAYVKQVKYKGNTYIVGASFFCDSPVLTSILIVEAIKRYWARLGDQKALEIANNPEGSLVYGPVFGIVMDMKGECWANGHNVLLVGQNLLDPRSVGKGTAVAFKKVLETIQSRDYFWVEFKEYGLLRRLYCQKFKDMQTQRTFVIMAGYYPDLNVDKARQLGDDAASLIAQQGLTKAVKSLTKLMRPMGTVLKGYLDVLIMDTAGTVEFYSYAAEGAAFLGRSIKEYVDDAKRPYNKMLLSKLETADRAWVSRFHKRTMERLYGRKVETPEGVFIVQIRGYYPYLPQELVEIVVDDAYDHLQAENCLEAFEAFRKSSGPFVNADSFVYIYDVNGICWLDGIQDAGLWSKRDFLVGAQQGWVDSNRLASSRRWHVRTITKQIYTGKNEEFLICSNYYPVK